MVQQVALQHHTEGVRKLFDAAVACGNLMLAEQYRGTMHDLLDQQLDTTASVITLTTKLMQLTGDE